MKSIKTLIKLSKQKLDEKRRELAELEKQREQLIEYSNLMTEELRVEQEFAAREPEMSITFDSYRKRIMEKQANITFALREISRQSLVISDAIAELYGEMKKYEIVLEQKILEEANERKIRDGKVLDEIARGNYIKNMDEVKD
jgi:flagellar FliJ protein